MRVASKVDNLPSKFGHARLGLSVLELFAMYATDGQTDGRTKATLIAPFRGHNKVFAVYSTHTQTTQYSGHSRWLQSSSEVSLILFEC